MTKNKLKKKIDSNIDRFVEVYGITPVFIKVEGNIPHDTIILEDISLIKDDESVDNLLKFAKENIANHKFSLGAPIAKEFCYLEI